MSLTDTMRFHITPLNSVLGLALLLEIFFHLSQPSSLISHQEKSPVGVNCSVLSSPITQSPLNVSRVAFVHGGPLCPHLSHLLEHKLLLGRAWAQVALEEMCLESQHAMGDLMQILVMWQ